MAGESTGRVKLDQALAVAGEVMRIEKIHDWFIGYGTLLGIARDGHCIDGDDDVDIIISNVHYGRLKSIFERIAGIDYGHGIGRSTQILKTKSTQHIGSIDFYCCDVTKLMRVDYHDKWEKAKWLDCHPFETLMFHDVKLNLPKNYKSKLKCRYGDWGTPSNEKKGGKTPNYLL